MMKILRTTLAALVLAAASIGSAWAHDGSGVGFSINIGTPGYYSAPPVVSYGPPVVYYSAPPVVYYRNYAPRAYYRSYAPHRYYERSHRDWGRHGGRDWSRHGGRHHHR